jgi:cysteine sulfinate desulfinase/cysteine desulfurase-like protein
MPEENEKKPEEPEEPPEEGEPEEEPEEETEGEPEEKKGRNFGALVSPEGVVMLSIAGILDFLSIIGAVLIALFGIGLIFSKIVYIFGLILIGGWSLFRSGTIPTKKKGVKGKTTEMVKKKLGEFFKRHWKRLGVKFIPVLGDIIPNWTITVYKELTS